MSQPGWISHAIASGRREVLRGYKQILKGGRAGVMVPARMMDSLSPGPREMNALAITFPRGPKLTDPNDQNSPESAGVGGRRRELSMNGETNPGLVGVVGRIKTVKQPHFDRASGIKTNFAHRELAQAPKGSEKLATSRHTIVFDGKGGKKVVMPAPVVSDTPSRLSSSASIFTKMGASIGPLFSRPPNGKTETFLNSSLASDTSSQSPSPLIIGPHAGTTVRPGHAPTAPFVKGGKELDSQTYSKWDVSYAPMYVSSKANGIANLVRKDYQTSEQLSGAAGSGSPTGSRINEIPAGATANTGNGPMEGNVYLDGTLVGRWMRRELSRSTGRQPSGGTLFDPTRSRLPAGAMIGV